MKNFTVLMLLLFVSACATGPATNLEKEVDEGKNGEQDVKTVDKTYSTDIRSFSNLKKTKSKISCNNYLKVKKENWRDLLEAGYSCIQKKKWNVLSSIAEKLSHNHLKAPWGPYYRSIVSEHKGDLARAVWMADLALKKAPGNSMILFQKARVLWMVKEETSSYEMMKKVVKLNPENYDAILFLGNIHYRDRDFKEALVYYNKILKVNSKDSKYRAAMGDSYFHTGKYKESVKHYKVAVYKERMNASLLYKIGLSYKFMKDWGRSKTYLEKAVAQKRKGRGLASVSAENMIADLKSVKAKIEASKGKNRKKIKVAKGAKSEKNK